MMADNDITKLQAVILSALATRESMTLEQISVVTKISKHSLPRLHNDFLDRGLIVSSRPGHHKPANISITPAGFDALLLHRKRNPEKAVQVAAEQINRMLLPTYQPPVVRVRNDGHKNIQSLGACR